MSKKRWLMTSTLLLSLATTASLALAQLRPLPKIAPKVEVRPTAVERPHMAEARMVTPTPAVLESLAKAVDKPNVEVGIEPLEDGAIVYHPVAGKTGLDAATAQVSIVLGIKNKESKTIKLKQISLSTTGADKSFSMAKDIGAGATYGWQNNREYHQAGDILYLSSPIPNSIEIKLVFDGYSAPVKITKSLKPYGKSFTPPFKASDLAKDEVWEGGSTHGGGSQAFAYDLGVHGYSNGWSGTKAGKDRSENANFRVWGKPIYAMADGEVVGFLNDCPNNWKPDPDDAGMQKQKDELWGTYTNGGSGNHLYIQHGDVVALYAHMQKGSITSKFLTKGAKVKKGEKLGLAGNSGNSTAPHLHVHLRKETSPETGPFRPLIFKDAYAIYKTAYTSPKSNVNWSKLAGHGIPGYVGDRSYIWPSPTHPYCEYAPGAAVARHGVTNASYQEVFDSIWTCGSRPTWVDGFEAGGKTYFNVIFQAEDAPWVARHNLSAADYQAEFDKWGQAGYRLANVDSYMNNGKVRYAAVWTLKSGPALTAYHGVDDETHQSKFEELTKAGWAPVNVSAVMPDGKRQITALYQKADVNGLYARHAMTPSQYQGYFDEYHKKGFKLVYLNGYDKAGSPLLSAIWYGKTPFGGYIAKHDLTGSSYQTEFDAQGAAGFSTRAVTGYDKNGSARYGALWVK